MSFSYNESVIHYILFNMELTATVTWEIGDNAIDDIDDGNDNDDHDLDAIDPTVLCTCVRTPVMSDHLFMSQTSLSIYSFY